MPHFHAFLRLFMRFFALLAVLPCAARGDDASASASSGTELREYVNNAEGISFAYPSSWRETPLRRSGGALVRLAASGGTYPTLNVLLEPGAYQAEGRPLEDQTRRVLESYKAVGISDATAVERVVRTVARRNSFHALLRYSYQGKVMLSGVTIIPGDHRHFIVTFIDEESNYRASRSFEDAVLNSLTIADTLVRPPQADRRFHPAALTVGGVLLVAALFLWRWRRGRNA